MCVTSPPYYGLRDYGNENQIGLEESPRKYVQKLVSIFDEVKRVLKNDGTLWLNLGDSYYNYRNTENTYRKQTVSKTSQDLPKTSPIRNIVQKNLKGKDLIGIPWMVAFALRNAGWYLRQDIIWAKSSCMPESVEDRCTKSHEYIFLLAKSSNYFFNHTAISEPTRRKRSVWNINPKCYPKAHFATFPSELVLNCILAGSEENGIVLDPFMGSGTTASVCKSKRRKYVGIELIQDYIKLAEERIKNTPKPLDMKKCVT